MAVSKWQMPALIRQNSAPKKFVPQEKTGPRAPSVPGFINFLGSLFEFFTLLRVRPPCSDYRRPHRITPFSRIKRLARKINSQWHSPLISGGCGPPSAVSRKTRPVGSNSPTRRPPIFRSDSTASARRNLAKLHLHLIGDNSRLSLRV